MWTAEGTVGGVRWSTNTVNLAQIGIAGIPNVVGPFSHCVLMALSFWTMLVSSMIVLPGIPYLCKIFGMYTCLGGMYTCLNDFFQPVVYVSFCFSQYYGVFEVNAVPCLDDFSSSNSCLQPRPTGCVCV